MLEDKFFAGIGSRETPETLKNFMAAITYYLVAYCNFKLRSGRAKGADQFFESGLPIHLTHMSEIFLPEIGFGGKNLGVGICVTRPMSKMDSIEIIRKYEIVDKWDALLNNPASNFIVGAHIRNMFQVLGDLSDGHKPVNFVVCWTPDGAKTASETSDAVTGGTRSAIRIASKLGIPVYNLAVKADLMRLYNRISKVNIPFSYPSLQELEVHCVR